MIATLLVVFALAAFRYQENQGFQAPLLKVGEKTSHVIEAFRSLRLRPIHGSRILLLQKENIFPNSWIVFFVACLVWNDHSLRMWVETSHELTPEQLAKVDYIISVTEFEATLVRSPHVKAD